MTSDRASGRPSLEAPLVGVWGATAILFGVVVSGPLAVLLVQATHPQPVWQGPSVFARHYHPIQILPYLGGFFLLGGFVLSIAALHALARAEHRAASGCALVLVSVYAALVSLNYIVQTTFVPGLTRGFVEANAGILSAFSMSNPTSLAWALEMWGYAFLGAATWLVSPIVRGGKPERALSALLAANGPLSILPALVTMMVPGWVMSTPGLVGLVLWNVLVATMAGLALRYFSKRRAGARPANPVAATTEVVRQLLNHY